MLTFTNPGELDIRLATIFGANVKESSNPIGYFGTGLKYAIAVTLRLGGSITIYSGTTRYTFSVESQEIRGKTFGRIVMDAPTCPEMLGFTLELGKHWEPWMAYRELYTNALDEGGTVEPRLLGPRHGHTHICVSCPAIEHIYEVRDKYFLSDPNPTLEADGVQIFARPSNMIFYRGIAVEALAEPSALTYNFTRHMDLTEDRTLGNLWIARATIARALALTDQGELIHAALAPKRQFESSLDFSYVHTTPTRTFMDIAMSHSDGSSDAARSAARLANQHRDPTQDWKPVVLDEQQELQYVMAQAALQDLGFSLENEVIFTATLPPGVMGCAKQDKIYISTDCFIKGTKYLASTLLEEHIHITKGFEDLTRDLQTYLFDLVLTLGERLRGEPL